MTFAKDGEAQASHAAYLLHTGRVSNLEEAIRIAGGGGRVSRSRVQQHLAAMRQQDLGEEDYNALRAGVLEVALECMDAIEQLLERFPERFPASLGTRLAGKAAAGRIEELGVVHVRVLATIKPAELADLLVGIGCDEPAFDLLQTSLGKLERIRTRLRGVEVCLVVCPPEKTGSRGNTNLITGMPVSIATVDEVAQLLESIRGER